MSEAPKYSVLSSWKCNPQFDAPTMLALICWLCASTVGLVHTWSSYALSQFACTAVQVAITAQYAMRLDCSVQTTHFLLLKLTTHSWSYACDAWTETMLLQS